MRRLGLWCRKGDGHVIEEDGGGCHPVGIAYIVDVPEGEFEWDGAAWVLPDDQQHVPTCRCSHCGEDVPLVVATVAADHNWPSPRTDAHMPCLGSGRAPATTGGEQPGWFDEFIAVVDRFR